MIAQLRGTLTYKSPDHVVVDVGGVGYHVFISLSSHEQLPAEGSDVALYVYTYLREDQLSLFGFITSAEKAIFQRLISVSGIGPKMAMALLSGIAPTDLVNSVVRGDLARLCAIPGIGKKTAERIVVDLKDKFIKEFAPGQQAPSSAGAGRPIYNDAVSALMNLGYSRSAAEKVLSAVDFDNKSTVQSIVRQALKELAAGNC